MKALAGMHRLVELNLRGIMPLGTLHSLTALQALSGTLVVHVTLLSMRQGYSPLCVARPQLPTRLNTKWSSLVCCATAWPYPVGSDVDLPVAEPGREKHAQPGRKGGKTVYHAAEVLRVRNVNLLSCTLTQV